MPDELSAEADPRTIDDILMAQQQPDASSAGAIPVVPPRQMFKPNDPAFNYELLQREMAKRQQFNDMSEMDAWIDWQGYGENEAIPYRNEYMLRPGEFEDAMKRSINPHSPIDDDMIERSFRMYKDYGKRI